MQNGQDKWKISKGMLRTKTQWVLTEKQLNSSGKSFQDFRHCPFLKKSNKTWRNGRSNQRSSQIGSSSCQCLMTFCGNQMIRICLSNAEEVKNYAKKFLPRYWTFLDPGSEERWFVDSHDQKGQWEIAQPTKWYSDSKKLIILFSNVPTHWIVELCGELRATPW